jgi:hypothetical protein
VEAKRSTKLVNKYAYYKAGAKITDVTVDKKWRNILFCRIRKEEGTKKEEREEGVDDGLQHTKC